MQKKVLFAIGLAGLGGMVSPTTAQAQDNVTVVVNDGKVKSNSISGVVYSADDNEPLIGAQVRIVGANVVTITDVNGRFSFKSVELKKQKLQVSYIGMETQTVTAGHEMKVVLKRDSKTLSDVVVNGYFTRKKQTFTGAAKTVTSDEIMKVAPNNILQTLATLDPSLNIAQNNAAGSNPNAVPDLVIRSTTSLSTSNEVGLNAPLIVIDGVEQSLQALYDMDINDIERVDILKDASATALYGENAANGVIVIERKRVSQSPVRIRYTVTPQLSFADLSSYDYCNAAQKLELEKRAGLYKSETGKLDESYFEKLALVTSGIDTDWKSKPVRNSFSHNHSLSISGRGSGLDYNVNANYQNTQGVMKDDGRTRYGMNVYLSYTAINNLVITLRASHDQLNTNSSKYGSFSSYLECNPYDSPYDQYGNLRSELSYEMNNPLYEASLSSFDKSQSRTQQVSLDVRYNIKPNFFITAQGSYNTSRGTSDVFRSPDSHDFKNVTNISQKGKYTLGNTGSDQWAAKLVGNYIHNFDNDGTMLTLNLGGEIKRSKSTSSTLVATGFLSDEQNDIAYATTYPDGGKPSGSEDLSASLGGFLAANFMWKNRYVLDGSYRVSGSSKFGSDHRYAPFWSVGAGWNIHNEEFAKKLGWINTLRLRGSYGYTGSVKFSSYQAVTTYKYNSDYLSYTGVGAIPMGMANPDLKWQTTKKLNVGITSSLFGDRLNVNFDVYNEKTTDMLIDRSLPPSSGTTSVKANLGSQTSNGIEFSLWGKIIKTRDWEWSLSVNGLHSKTTINNISDAMKRMNEQNASGFTSSDGSTNIASSSPLFQYREGESPSAIYAVRSAGIDPATGNEIFIKKDGSYTYKYDSKDQVSCGDTNPTLQGSISSMLQYKNFSLTASFSYRFGGEMYNSTRALKVENVNPRKNCDVRAFTDRWTNVGDVKPYIDIAKATGNTSVYTDRFVEKDDELWLSSLYLQYNVPMTFLKKLHIQKMYLGIGTEDLFRITSAKYERGTSYPFSRSINMSASLTF
ncbi:MAG: SusC/RagA family TonB-linked outer membrane protein [Prevotella sp.]|uniref:SusC/RagA family TonB-linked outer membrane protein n=2 Tax=uncultured Prevotella sp. TaxID=159272 RepID=UPI0025ECDA7F|nr:SusC/RagA family TonB-linked outer membrane protein [Prevotella sp.]MCI7184297.1 SusC/RagA family TonB-linked outer membrane protein [Prevotella sp.]MDD6198055.1 SusC/RagA family TonB-linked outer membrane protein [Prevotella sp.]